MINQSTERIARPEKVCMSTEREFLLLIKPDSKKPSAGIINITRPVEISIHEVSPALMVNVHQNYALGFTPLEIIVDNLSQEYYLMLVDTNIE